MSMSHMLLQLIVCSSNYLLLSYSLCLSQNICEKLLLLLNCLSNSFHSKNLLYFTCKFRVQRDNFTIIITCFQSSRLDCSFSTFRAFALRAYSCVGGRMAAVPFSWGESDLSSNAAKHSSSVLKSFLLFFHFFNPSYCQSHMRVFF